MAVIVNHGGVADLLDTKIEALGAERAQATFDVIDAVGMGPDRHQLWRPVHERGAAGLRAGLGGAKPNQAQRLQKMPTIHDSHPSFFVRCLTVHPWPPAVQPQLVAKRAGLSKT